MTSKEKEEMNKGLSILKKMGFRERIGRFEDGILRPISPEKVSGRQGLGYNNTSQHSTLNCSDPSTFEETADNCKQKSPSVSIFTKRKRVENVVNQENEVLPLSDNRHDTMRRGILVDLDVLILNHRARRMQALKATIESLSEVEFDWNDLQGLLEEDEESDWDLLRNVLSFLYSTLLSEDEMTCIYEKLESNLMKQPLERNIKAQQICEKLSETPLIRVGFFHKGSRQRMNEEMRILSIRDLQMCKYSLSLDTFAHVPYNEQWNELCRRLGVSALYCNALIVSNHLSKLEAGFILNGIRPIRWNVVDNSLTLWNQSISIHCEELIEFIQSKTPFFENFTNSRLENVLARFSLDGLWYLATAMKLNESKYYWVTYKGWENSEIREEQDIDIISPQAEEMFHANQYRGISTPQKQKIFKCLPKKIERINCFFSSLLICKDLVEKDRLQDDWCQVALLFMKNCIVHFVSKIKNGRHKAIIEAPFSPETWEVAQALQRGGYIRAAAIDENTIRVLTKPFAIQDIKLLSKSSRPLFTDIPKYCSFIDQKLLWTPEGIFWDYEARKKRLGGELILRIR